MHAAVTMNIDERRDDDERLRSGSGRSEIPVPSLLWLQVGYDDTDEGTLTASTVALLCIHTTRITGIHLLLVCHLPLRVQVFSVAFGTSCLSLSCPSSSSNPGNEML